MHGKIIYMCSVQGGMTGSLVFACLILSQRTPIRLFGKNSPNTNSEMPACP